MRLVIDVKDSKANAFLTNQQKKAIYLGLKDFEQGNILTHEEALSELKKRYSKYFK